MRTPERLSWRWAITSAMRSRTRSKAVSDAARYQSVATSMSGTITSSVMAARAGCMMKSTMVTNTTVRPCTKSWTNPSWRSCVRLSRSLVIRVIRRPAFSREKKSIESRWKWLNTLMRRS